MVDLWNPGFHRGPSTFSDDKEVKPRLKRMDGSVTFRKIVIMSKRGKFVPVCFFYLLMNETLIEGSICDFRSAAASPPIPHQVKRCPVQGLGPSSGVHHLKLSST